MTSKTERRSIRVPCIRSTHPWSFKSGEWLTYLGLTVCNDRLCFLVLHEATLSYDAWPITDPDLIGKIEWQDMFR